MNRNFNINGLDSAGTDAGLEPARAQAFVPLVNGGGLIESVTEEQSMQNGAVVAIAGRTSKGGRPRKCYDYLIGTVHHFLVIDRIFRRAQNEPYAATTCTRCGTHTECRLRDILSGHTKSCKCLRPEQYLTNVGSQADQLPEQKVAQIWSMHFSGAGRWAIAIEHKLAVIVVDFALRRYQRILDGIINTGRALLMATRAVTPQVRDYLRKAEYRFQNVLRRASERAVESDKTCRAWERMMRRYIQDHAQEWHTPIGPDDEVEFLNE